MYISNNAVIANLPPHGTRPLSRVKKLTESQSADNFASEDSTQVPNTARRPLATPRGALEEKMLEQILEMISSNQFDDEVIGEIKNQLSEDGNGTVGNLVDVGA